LTKETTNRCPTDSKLLSEQAVLARGDLTDDERVQGHHCRPGAVDGLDPS
jgi:hypothetical protein